MDILNIEDKMSKYEKVLQIRDYLFKQLETQERSNECTIFTKNEIKNTEYALREFYLENIK